MRALGSVVPAALAEILRTSPHSDGKIAFAWNTVVGPAIERTTAVRLDNGVLIVETAGPQWTREIERSSVVILARLRGLLGTGAITRLEIRTNTNLKSSA